MLHLAQQQAATIEWTDFIGPGVIAAAAFFVWLYSRMRGQDELLWTLYTDFNKPEMLKARADGEKIVMKFKEGDDLQTLYNKSPEDFIKIWMVLAFYCGLYKMIKSDRVRQGAALDTFDKLIVWWWYYLKKAGDRIPETWPGDDELPALQRMVKDHMLISGKNYEEFQREAIRPGIEPIVSAEDAP
ncbi:MAG: hypothetical protein AAFN41_11800 [Planctomycetota bacterium]